jgi:hypothetical protein
VGRNFSVALPGHEETVVVTPYTGWSKPRDRSLRTRVDVRDWILGGNPGFGATFD